MKIEAKEGWAALILQSEEERQKFKQRVLCPEGSRARVDGGQVGGLESLQRRLEAAAVKATTPATRDKNIFKIPVQIRKLAMEAAKCRNTVLTKDIWKEATKARRSCGNQQIYGGKHRAGMNSEFSLNPSVKVFRLQAVAIPL